MSKALDKRVIACANEPLDYVEIDDADLGNGYALIQTYSRSTSGSEGPAVMLDKEAARELFNWLGVWLHK